MKTATPTVADMGEFGLIRTIQENCLFSNSKIIKGIGDDCAVIGPHGGKVFLVTTDLLLEDTHFILDKILPEHLGEKAIRVNLSDIAAMGGTALHSFISMAVPKTTPMETIHGLYRGIKKVCKEYDVDILGGDTSSSPEKIMISVTMIGESLEHEVLYRSGADSGDLIYVTGTIGDSAGGLKLIMGKASAPEPLKSALVEAHYRPEPFLKAGRMIAQSQLASAMIDLSDGLVADLAHICESSRQGACVFQKDLPISDNLRMLADINGFDPYETALFGGEDYRLLVIVPRKNSETFLKIFKKGTPCPIFCVGEMTEKKGISLKKPTGEITPINLNGFDHFLIK